MWWFSMRFDLEKALIVVTMMFRRSSGDGKQIDIFINM